MIPGYDRTIEYRVRVDLKPGEEVPSADAVMGALNVGAEGSPEELHLAPFTDNVDVLLIGEASEPSSAHRLRDALLAIAGWASDEGPLKGKGPMEVAQFAREAIS